MSELVTACVRAHADKLGRTLWHYSRQTYQHVRYANRHAK